jgi:hypothetical protein
MGRNNKKKTTCEFIDELCDVQPSVRVIGEYVNSKTNIDMYCTIHNIPFKQIPSKALIGQCGCRECGIAKGKRYKKTHEEFMSEMDLLHPNINILGQYDGNTKHIPCECRVCGHKWDGLPNSLLSGSGCIVCGNKRSGMLRSKTNQQFLDELSKVTETIVPLEEYKTALTKIWVECTECSRKWQVEPNSLLQGKGCSVCNSVRGGEKLRKSHSQFVSELFEKYPNLIVNNKYVTMHHNINFTCLDCHNTFDRIAADIFYDGGCPVCNVNNLPQRQPKTLEQFLIDLQQINKDISYIDGYTKASSRVHVKCNMCEYEWSPIGTSLTSGTGCPVCNMSHGERKIKDYLSSHMYSYMPQQTFFGLVGVGGGDLSYDFYIPDYNVLIEFQGEYHDGTAKIQTEAEFIRQQEHDRRKRQYAEEHNIGLLEIWYYEYNDIENILNDYFTKQNDLYCKIP